MLPLKGSSSTCGYHVEGDSNAGQTISFAQHVKALGGAPAYYDMDEPLLEWTVAPASTSHRAAVIYNGSGQDKSDDDWVNHAIEHAKTFEQVVRPDSVGSS